MHETADERGCTQIKQKSFSYLRASASSAVHFLLLRHFKHG
jgi:hypothetical protein